MVAMSDKCNKLLTDPVYSSMSDKCNKFLTRFRSVAGCRGAPHTSRKSDRSRESRHSGFPPSANWCCSQHESPYNAHVRAWLRMGPTPLRHFRDGKTPHLLSHSSASETCQIKRRFSQATGGIIKVFMTLTLPLEPQEEAKLVAAARARGYCWTPSCVRLGRILFSESAAEAPGKSPRGPCAAFAQIRHCSIG